MVLYVILMLFLGTILDTSSIILIVAPLFLPLIELMLLVASIAVCAAFVLDWLG